MNELLMGTIAYFHRSTPCPVVLGRVKAFLFNAPVCAHSRLVSPNYAR